MKLLTGMMLAMLSLSVGAAGVHVDDIEYQATLNLLVPMTERVISAVNRANNAADEVDQVKGSDNTVQFCQKLFTGTGFDCTASTGEQWQYTDGLEKLMNRSQQVYNCATGGTCGTADRIRGLRRQTNELANVAEGDATLNVKYDRMFDSMVSAGRNLLDTLLNSDLINEQMNSIEGSKTSTALCQQLFPAQANGECTAGAGNRAYDRTVDLEASTDAMDTLFDCVKNVSCTVSDRLSAMRKFAETR